MRKVPMFRLRFLSVLMLSAGAALAACDGSGDNHVPDEANQQTTADSMSQGTNITPVNPPVGTVNPGAPSGPGVYPNADSTVAAPGATGGPVQSGATGPVGNVSGETTADSARH
jgi:hypothetical protein